MIIRVKCQLAYGTISVAHTTREKEKCTEDAGTHSEWWLDDRVEWDVVDDYCEVKGIRDKEVVRNIQAPRFSSVKHRFVSVVDKWPAHEKRIVKFIKENNTEHAADHIFVFKFPYIISASIENLNKFWRIIYRQTQGNVFYTPSKTFQTSITT